MASKDHCRYQLDKPDLAVNKSSDAFSNFTLNQSHKCSTAFNQTCLKNAEIGSRKSSNYDVAEKTISQNGRSISLKKFHKNLPKDYYFDPNLNKEETKERKDSSKIKNASTLSLHIAAYENFFEGQASDSLAGKELRKKNTTSTTLKNPEQQLPGSFFNNQLEFPRQQENKPSESEVQKFAASQRLFTPIQESINPPTAVSRTLRSQIPGAAMNHFSTTQIQLGRKMVSRPKEADVADGMEKLPRMILIDGFNIMHHFKNLDHRDPLAFDESMCPIILLPLLLKLSKDGLPVRIVLKTMPEINKVSHDYILRELEHMRLIFYSPHNETEKDDLLMLDLAKKYGAKIITRDQFRNHKGYEKIVENYSIEYDRAPGEFSIEKLQRHLCYKSTVEIHESQDSFYAYEDDEDFEAVKASAKKYPPLPSDQIQSLEILQLYVYNYLRYCYGFGISNQVNFLKFGDEFPMTWIEFRARFHEFVFEEWKKGKTEKSRLELLMEEMAAEPSFDIQEEDCYFSKEE